MIVMMMPEPLLAPFPEVPVEELEVSSMVSETLSEVDLAFTATSVH